MQLNLLKNKKNNLNKIFKKEISDWQMFDRAVQMKKDLRRKFNAMWNTLTKQIKEKMSSAKGLILSEMTEKQFS